MPSAAQKQQIAVISKGKAGPGFVNVHSVNVLRIFQRRHIRTVLIQFQEIASVLVDHRKMRRDDDFARADPCAVRDSRRALHFPHKSVLIDVQSLCDRIQKSERVELCLVLEADCSHSVHRQGQVFCKHGVIADL